MTHDKWDVIEDLEEDAEKLRHKVIRLNRRLSKAIEFQEFDVENPPPEFKDDGVYLMELRADDAGGIFYDVGWPSDTTDLIRFALITNTED